jgi:hypothetical protein
MKELGSEEEDDDKAIGSKSLIVNSIDSRRQSE